MTVIPWPSKMRAVTQAVAVATTGSARHIPGFNAPSVGFEDPFAMLQACHERVLRTLALLARLRAHVSQHGVDGDARQAARDVLRYFDIAAPLHHQDEELHVFPLLLLSGASAEVRALVLRLLQDHVFMTDDWAAARAPLQALVEQGEDADGAGLIFRFTPKDDQVLDRFATRYDDHIAAEEGVVYPAAMQLLPSVTLAAMGREMAARRGAW